MIVLLKVLTSVEQAAGLHIEVPKTETVSHEEVLVIGKKKADVMRRLVERIISCVPNMPGSRAQR